MKIKRGPKSQTLIMVPLAELIAKLPATSNVKISRVWFQELQETLGLSPFTPESTTAVSAAPETAEQISVTTLDLSDDQD
jgi:hypothetical protein